MSAPVVMRFYGKPEDLHCKSPDCRGVCDEFVRGPDFDHLAAENARLRQWLDDALTVIANHTAFCKDLHHAKRDQHEGHMECPVEKRISEVEARGWELLRALSPAKKENERE